VCAAFEVDGGHREEKRGYYRAIHSQANACDTPKRVFGGAATVAGGRRARAPKKAAARAAAASERAAGTTKRARAATSPHN
jgi:hypothetical protein